MGAEHFFLERATAAADPPAGPDDGWSVVALLFPGGVGLARVGGTRSAAEPGSHRCPRPPGVSQLLRRRTRLLSGSHSVDARGRFPHVPPLDCSGHLLRVLSSGGPLSRPL